jgi:hypothetical protein
MTRFEHIARGAYISVIWRDEQACWDPGHARRMLYLAPLYSARATLDGVADSQMRLLPALGVGVNTFAAALYVNSGFEEMKKSGQLGSLDLQTRPC